MRETINDMPTILVTNDDGVFAPGIRTLIKVMRKLGRVVVVAPDRARSAQGHAITVSSPLRVKKLKEEEFTENTVVTVRLLTVLKWEGKSCCAVTLTFWFRASIMAQTPLSM